MNLHLFVLVFTWLTLKKCCERCREILVPQFRGLALILNWNIHLPYCPNGFFKCVQLFFLNVKQHMVKNDDSVRGCTVKSLPFDSWYSRSCTFSSFLVPPTFKKSSSLFCRSVREGPKRNYKKIYLQEHYALL